MTSLQDQLKRIGTADLRNVTEGTRRHKASFLFTSKEAADQDLETIYSIAHNGIMELVILDSKFAPFQKTLFSEKMKGYDRVLQTAEENAKLDKSITAFLHQLSPYFLLKPAGKAVEWLIRRFRVHDFNVEAMLACILPYHETKSFVRMVALLQIQENTSWSFLLPVKKSNIPLDRSMLIKAMKKSRRILSFVCKTVIDAPVPFQILYSFFAATLTDFVNATNRVTDDTMVALLPYLIDSVARRQNPELQIAAYMVVSQLCSREALSHDALVSITNKMLMNYSESFFSHCLLTIVHIAQSQHSFQGFSHKAVKRIFNAPAFETCFLDIAQKYAIDRFMSLTMTEFCKAVPNSEKKAELLNNLAVEGLLSHDNIRLLSSCAIKGYLELEEPASESGTAYIDAFRPLLVTLSQRYIEDLDVVLEEEIKSVQDDTVQSKALYEFSAAGFKGTGHEIVQEANTTLYLSLNSPAASTRLLAMKRLVNVIGDKDSPLVQNPEIIESSLLGCLESFNELLLYVVCDIPNHLLKFVPGRKILASLSQLLQERGAFRKEAVPVLKFLLGDFSKQYPKLSIDVARILALFVFAAPGQYVKSLVKQVKDIELDGKSALGQLLGHLREILQSVKEKEEDVDSISKLFIIKEASSFTTSPNFWTSMIGEGSAPQKIIALLVVTQAMKGYSNASNYMLITHHILDPMSNDEKVALYETKLPASFTTTDGTLPDKTVSMLRKFHDLPKAAMTNLTQYTFSVMVTSLKAETTSVDWFNMSEKDQQYGALLKKLFETFVRGPTLGCFESMLSALVARHLKEDVFAFLMSIWIDQGYSAAVRARSLQIAASLMRQYVDGDNDLQHLIPSLIASLQDTEQRIRLCATQCLRQLRRLYSRHGLIATKKDDKTQANGGKKASGLSILSANTIYAKQDMAIKDIRTQCAANFIEVISNRSHEITEDHACIFKLISDFFLSSEASKDKQTKAQGTAILNLLLDHIKKSPSTHIQVSLLTLLDDIHSPQKLQGVLPLLDVKSISPTLIGLLIRCYLPQNAAQFGKAGDKSLPLFLQLLQNSSTLQGEDEDGWQVSTRRCALKQISPEFFQNAKEKVQREIFGALVDIATNAEQHDVHLAKKVLGEIRIPVKLFDEFLTSVVSALNQTIADTEATAKRARKEKQRSAVDLYELVTVLELIESTVIEHDVLLVKRLFDTLAAMINAELRDAPVSLEYISQLIMSSLTRIIRTAEGQKESLEESTLRVDSVVQCIRTTSNPQTHNQALLLMATIASIYPETVLHNIMTVFTFMGANVLRQDDNYSFQVIHQTLEKIIPPLVESSRRNSKSQAAITLQIKPIIKVFVDALIHIPKHRRLPLFTVLIRTLGEGEFLYAIIALLLEKYAVRFSKEDDSESLAEFCKAISQQFSAETQINAVYSLLNDLHVLPNDKPQEDNEDTEMASMTTVFDLSEHSAKDLRRYKVIVLNYIDQLLVSRSFLAKVIEGMNVDPEFEEKMQPKYLQTVELLLKILSYFGNFRERYAVSEGAKSGVVKFWRSTIKVVYDVLDRVNGLLSLKTFVDVVSHLLKHADATVRRKAMNLFNERVAVFEQSISSEEEELLVGMTKEFIAAIENESRLGTGDEDGAINKQSALLCISTLARFSGNVYPAPFVDGLPVILGPDCLQLPNIQVKISSLSCLAVICQATGPRSIPHLPKFMPVIVELLSNNIKAENPSIMLRLAIVSCLETVVEELPHFMSPYIPKIFNGLLNSDIYEHDEEDPQTALVENKVTEVLSKMATKIPPRVLLNPVFACYESAMSQGKKSALAVVSVVSDAVHTMSNDVMIFKFFLMAFDVRRQYGDKFNDLDIGELESAMINVFLDLVMKLNETLFKPLYLKIVDWATVELAEEKREESEKRVLFFYKLLDSLFDRLKSIVTPYFGYVVDDVINRLQQYTSGEAGAPGALWNYIMLSLRKSFQYDNDNLWNASKFDKVLDPVVEQMMFMGENESPDQYLTRMSTYLVPCLGQMAQTVANDTLWKPMNYKVLMKTREDVPEIRLAALKCLEEFYTCMGEEWLLFLAESISFLAELMEDDDRRVEKLVQQVNAQIELHLGESLDKFFN
ncbi:hypothetical protein BDB00DRAFT_883490 [Zychaea mexicana]|uniref:uncharacterized protein n=1 Tax=Zychaea mexicana TaxID=64656 RepID=UPI0022FE76AE|nr:uncharacterized protein BDB00DRAFT_883490 [Zychaea mexicana]KAI9492397.1 hypothetical protein BDB00DRAFT_883490 [Zychaea mexicana]